MLLKKHFVFIICLLFFSVMLLSFWQRKFGFSFFASNKDAEHLFFVKEQQSNAKYEGLFFITNEVHEENKIVGEGIIIDENNSSLNQIKSFFNAKIVFVENIYGNKVVYLQSNLLKKEMKVNGKTFNLQVIFDKEKIKIFYPINFGSF